MRRNRPHYSKFLSSPITLVASLVLLFFLGRAALNINAKTNTINTKLEEATVSLNKLSTNKEKITRELESISTEAGIKAEIREKYHAVEPGEQVAVIVDQGDQRAAVALTASSTTPSKPSFWKRFIGIFGFK